MQEPGFWDDTGRAGKVSAEEMQVMNDAVDGQHMDVEVVVRGFRLAKGL